MKYDQSPIQTLRDRLTETLAEWGAEMSTVLQELEQKRSALSELESSSAARGEEYEALKAQIQSHDELVASLREEAGEAARLRRERDEKETQIERLSADNESKDAQLQRLASELESKQDLIGALRRETQARIEALEAQIRSLREDEEEQAHGESAELAAVRAELDATLEEKREIIGTLEASINQHAETIAELKRASDMWKRKYQDLKGAATTTTATDLPAYVDTSFDAFEALEGESGSADGPSERTIAIDMRQSLLEARRRAAQSRSNGS